MSQNNFQQHWDTLNKFLQYVEECGTNIPYDVQTASEFMEKLSEQFIVLTVSRSEIDYLFGDKVGERLTDGQMTEIAAHMGYNEYLCDEKEEALKFTMDALHDIYPTPEDDEDEYDD